MAELIFDPLQGARLILMLRRGGITDSAVLGAIEQVPRSGYVAPELADLAYEDCILPIECGQFIMRPSEIAPLLQALKLHEKTVPRVLMVGAGSGYVMALIAALGAEVFGVERYGRLVQLAKENLEKQGVSRANVKQGDGLEGWPEEGPFDRIVLMGGIGQVPQTLLGQLAPGGFCLGPIGQDDDWELVSTGPNGDRLMAQGAGMQIGLSLGVSKAL